MEERGLGLEINGKGEVACSLVWYSDNASVCSLKVGDSGVFGFEELNVSAGERKFFSGKSRCSLPAEIPLVDISPATVNQLLRY